MPFIQIQEAALGLCLAWKKQAKTLNLHFDAFKEKISHLINSVQS